MPKAFAFSVIVHSGITCLLLLALPSRQESPIPVTLQSISNLSGSGKPSNSVEVDIPMRRDQSPAMAERPTPKPDTKGEGKQSHRDTAARTGDSGDAGIISASIGQLLRTIPYPLIAQEMRMRGLVIIECTVGPNGHVISAYVKKSSGFDILDNSALVSIEQWRFPEQDKSMRIEIPVRFILREVD